MTYQEYVPMKIICEELTSYGFSYKFGGSSPILQPWKLTENKAKKLGLLLEGERAIRRFWEEQVRPKLPDDFYKRRNVDDYMWVDEARKLLGFDGPEYKDRFATARRRDQGARTKAMPAGSAKNGAGMAEDTGGTGAHTSVSAKKAALREGRGPQEYVTSNSTKRSRTDDSRGGSRDNDNGKEVENIKKKRTLPKVEEKIHYKELLRRTLSERAGASTGKESGSRSDGLPGTKQGSHRLQSSIFTSASPHRLQKRIRNAPWMGAKEQADLFESLYARVAILSDEELRQASDLLCQGSPQMIGLVKAYLGKEANDACIVQFKRVLRSLVT